MTAWFPARPRVIQTPPDTLQTLRDVSPGPWLEGDVPVLSPLGLFTPGQFARLADRNQPNGYAGLDPTGVLLPIVLPVMGHVFFPEVNGAVGDGVADDTVALQNTINKAQLVGGKVYLSRTYRITATLIVSAPIEIDGVGCNALFGPRSVWGSDVTATVSPWLTGAVLLVTTAATDGLKITAVGNAVRLRNFGVRFADAIRFYNTGHGIVVDPGAYSTYRNNGLDCSTWENLKVYGHDGNHYGYYVINSQLMTLINLCSFGGGGIKWETNSGVGWYGNSTLINPYVFMCAPGAAVGYHLHNTVAAHGTILMTLIRPQTFKVDYIAPENLADAATWLPDTSHIATTGQAGFFADDDSYLGLHAYSVDMECTSNTESIRLPNDLSKTVWFSAHCPGSQWDGASILNGVVIRGGSSGGQAVMTGASYNLTGAFTAVPGLVAPNVPAGTWDFGAVLRSQVVTDGYATAYFTDSGGAALSPETNLYAFPGRGAQPPQVPSTVRGRITLNAVTTVQLRATVPSGACTLASDPAGKCYMAWTPVLR